MRSFTGCRWLLCLLLFAPAVPAEVTPEERAVARDLYEQATRAREQSDWQTCERRLGDAIAIVETPGLRFHLAYCQEQQQRWVEALVEYQRAAELIRNGANAPDVEQLLPTAITKLEAQVSHLELVVEPVLESAVLQLDGELRSPQLFGQVIPLNPGVRRVDLSAPGYHAFSTEIQLQPGEKRTLQVRLEQEATGFTPEPVNAPGAAEALKAVPSGWSAREYTLLSEAAVLVTGLGVGIGFSIKAGHQEDQQARLAEELGRSACTGGAPQPGCSELNQQRAAAQDSRRFATIGYVAAGVGASALVATWLLWPSPSGNAASLGLRLQADGPRAWFTGRF